VEPAAKFAIGRKQATLSINQGQLEFYLPHNPRPKLIYWMGLRDLEIPARLLGILGCWLNEYEFEIYIPIPMVLAVLTPLAVGPFTQFRFPLCSYFAWTALVAVELAYYLR
jgi:hypothetical protein